MIKFINNIMTTKMKEGQTKPTPPETDSLRKYYCSLLAQRKDSELALKWCLQHGLLKKKKRDYALMLFATKNLDLKKKGKKN